MERKSVTQRERIEKYYDTLLGQETGALSPDIVTYLLLVIAMMLLFIPVQELFVKGSSDRDLLFIVWTFTLFFTMSVSFYMMKYHAVSYGNNKTEAVSDMLLYMPLDRKENRRYLFGVMIRFLKKTTIAGLLMQLGVALIAYHSVSIWNIIYILVMTFVAPLVICGAQIMLRDIQPRR
nr:hypothetical protein [Lachnospiraceae bacterium]